MAKRPNFLFLMVDQMQAAVLDPSSPCRTPAMDRLARRGVRFTRATTPNPVCSPARASLMTGLLPHNHGMLWVHHCVDQDQGRLRTDRPHWAQALVTAGYLTAYFGKWHVEHTESPSAFGWQLDVSTTSDAYSRDPRPARHGEGLAERLAGGLGEFLLSRRYRTPGYRADLAYAVTQASPSERPMGKITAMAGEWLESASARTPWCCFVSIPEPHDPFIAGVDAWRSYDPDAVELPLSARDDLAGRPGLYRKAQAVWRDMTDREKREAAACYYASISEIDGVFGRLLETLDRTGQADNTIVVLTGDHGELLGAHGMYCKNLGAWEEIYRIPLVVAGPGIAGGETSRARVALHDLHPTILELAGLEGPRGLDGVSFREVLRDPARAGERRSSAYAEYFGTRFLLTQRILWRDNWKYALNGFDADEMYDLDNDPAELRNLADDPAHRSEADSMLAEIWRRIRESGDTTLLHTGYPILRLARFGPESEPGTSP